MASYTALYNGMSGLLAHGGSLDVIGDNIANSNTTGFKSSRTEFTTMFSQTFTPGAAPAGDRGGSNPLQIGHGVRIGGTTRDFSSGTVNATGRETDIAIDGNGFLVVERDGNRAYSRYGVLDVDNDGNLVTNDGGKVQGYGVDEEFRILPGVLTDLQVPVGTMRIAEATSSARLGGNLDADGTVGTRGASIVFDALEGRAGTAAGAGPADADTALVDLAHADDAAAPRFVAGQTIELRDVEKGGRRLPERSLAVADQTTVGDLLDFLRLSFGIRTDVEDAPGSVTLDGAGAITVEGNAGTVNDLDLDPADFVLRDEDGGIVETSPVAFEKTADANGESVRTTFVAYDSLGTGVEVDASVTLVGRDETGTTWQMLFESPESTDEDLRVGTGLLEFDTRGRLGDIDPISIALDRSGAGAESPLSVDIEFGSGADALTALSDTPSELLALDIDGMPPGTLTGFAFSRDGKIQGTFDNGALRDLGQIALATFANPQGLVAMGDHEYALGPNSGPARVGEPLTARAGGIVGGALEQSNVDLSEEFIRMILASTGYSAAGRVIDTGSEMLRQLVLLGR